MNHDLLDLTALLCVFLINVSLIRALHPVDYVAPANPCRLEDQFCSVKCSILQLKGDIKCDFCVCKNKTDYVRWQTTQDPLASTVSAGQTTTLPPDVIEVNNIRYHKISDPCFLSRDGVCPMKCTETKSVKADGSKCTMCDCKGAAVLIG
ncbi:uncharacterized protein LOC132749385 [Ruditapes philippinarum]|uniref:uncharacterized protein LOC132749385 n=1 Tax=Ruditapes philippinarum TaxID=129788 RepID=UPI00295B1CB6|nr:uncharacterized protein LOC132749385 [Ruditapes philippinarum]